MTFDAHIERALADLEAAGLLRTPRTIEGAQGPELTIEGRTVIGLCSNDYLGLAADPHLRAAATGALQQHSLGSGASRHISGTASLHRAAEARLADFVGAPAALLFSTGYAANLGAIQALMGPRDVIFSDELNHASLIDGCRLSRATVHVYRHADPEHLRQLLARQRHAHDNALVVTESLFSMDGDVAPLAELRALSTEHAAGLMVDEAHALGLFGSQGRGLCQQAGIRPDLLVGTLGKAFGIAGAFIAGPTPAVRLVENRARSFVFSTAPPPLLAATACVAVDLVTGAEQARKRVLAHAATLRGGLADLGYQVLPGSSPIIPILVGDADAAMTHSAALLARGVYVHGIRPPTVPEGSSRLRVTPIATHTDAHIQQALNAFAATSNHA